MGGGGNIGVKYRSRLRDVPRGVQRRASLGGFGGMLAMEYLAHGKICKNMLQLKRFGLYFEGILNRK